jgi:hypothetical protein
MNIVDNINSVAIELGMDRRISELAERVFSDYKPLLKWAYLFVQTTDNQESIFDAAESMKKQGLADKLLIISSDPKDGTPGFDAWYKNLGEKIGVEDVVEVPFDRRGNVNTWSESQALLRYAIDKNQGGLYVVSPEFHLLRAFMTAASEAIRFGHKYGKLIGIFNFPGEITRGIPEDVWWDKVVYHSQGTQRDKRRNLIKPELEKVKDYSNILPPQEILAYMDKRQMPQMQTVIQK